MLQLMVRTTSELGIQVPAGVAGNTSNDIVQLLALMNAAGSKLLSEYDWQELVQAYSFYTDYKTTTGNFNPASLQITGIPSTAGLDSTFMVTGAAWPTGTFVVSVDSPTQVTVSNYPAVTDTNETIYFQKVKYDMPSDYKNLIARTQWDRSKRWEMLGPDTAQQWEWIMNGFISTGPRVRWRILGGQFQIWPGFSNNENLGFEYKSEAWARSSTGAPKSNFTADADTCIFSDNIIVLGTKLKYFEAKGLDTTAIYRDYVRELSILKAEDSSAPTLSFAPTNASLLISWKNIPDSGYGP
jgi:hypothetical protein